MLKELRKVYKINKAKAQYIRSLQYEGRIAKLFNDKGYVCYDTDELKKFQASVHRGRPPKKVEGATNESI